MAKRFFTSESFENLISTIKSLLDGKADVHEHPYLSANTKYAGSSSAGGAATSANKLNTDAGSTTNPVYFANGVPVKTTHTLEASVPSSAKFTDTNTTYTIGTGTVNGTISVKASTDSAATNVAVKGLGSAAYTASTAYDEAGAADAVQDALTKHTSDNDVHFTIAERTKLSDIAAGAQVNTVTGVKGDSETSYRKGDINITKANIGLSNVDNTSDANKPVSTAQQTAIDSAVGDANDYTDEQIALLLNNASTETIDSIFELAAAIEENDSAIEALNTVAASKASSTHKHTVSHTPAGTVKGTSITPAGSVSSTFTGTAASHDHGFTGTKATISTKYTPAGSVSSSFTGSVVNSGTPDGTAPSTTVASSDHTHEYTPGGSVSQPTFTGTAAAHNHTFTGSAVTSGAPSGSVTVYSITAVGSLPSHTYTAPTHSYTAPSLTPSCSNRCLTLTFSAGSHSFSAGSHSFSAGTLPTKGEGVSVATGAHTHSVTAAGTVENKSITPAGTVSKPTFTGTKASTTSISGTASVASITHIHSVTAAGTVSSSFAGTEATISTDYTPAGTVGSKSITPSGSVSSSFTGTAASHDHGFTGTAASLTTSTPN